MKISVHKPFLAIAENQCWRCRHLFSVAAVFGRSGGEEGPQGFAFFNYDVPDNVLMAVGVALKGRGKWEMRRSKQAGYFYFMNICPECDAHSGDYFLFADGRGPFSAENSNHWSYVSLGRQPVVVSATEWSGLDSRPMGKISRPEQDLVDALNSPEITVNELSAAIKNAKSKWEVHPAIMKEAAGRLVDMDGSDDHKRMLANAFIELGVPEEALRILLSQGRHENPAV